MVEATNVIKIHSIVITPIGIDHQQFLGESIQEIASEKAGIIKDKCKTVLSYQDKNIIPIFQDIISARNNISKIWNKDILLSIMGKILHIPIKNIRCHSHCQIYSAGTRL